MKLQKNTVNMIAYIFRFSLLSVFIIGLLSLTIVGVSSYRSINERVDNAYNARSSLSYVATKIRQNDRADAISITRLDNTPVLVLSEGIDGKIYETRIYSYQNNLYEDFSESKRELTLGKGQIITPAKSFDVRFIADRLIKISLDDEKTITIGVQSDNSGSAENSSIK